MADMGAKRLCGEPDVYYYRDKDSSDWFYAELSQLLLIKDCEPLARTLRSLARYYTLLATGVDERAKTRAAFAARRTQAQDNCDHALRINRDGSATATNKYNQGFQGSLREATRDYRASNRLSSPGFSHRCLSRTSRRFGGANILVE